MYKSNGQSLLSDQCRFTLVGTDDDVKNCQGGTQLLYEGNTGKLYLGGLYRDGGWEKIYLAEVNTSTGKLTEITTKKLSNSITSTDYQAGFRWGGCFVSNGPNNLEVYGVARTLTYGPAQNYTKVKKWSRKKYLKIYNAGADDAKYTLHYTSGGVRKKKTGRLSAGQWKSYSTAWDASDFHLKANAVWGKEIINRNITPNQCYRFKGTTLINSYDNGCN